MVASLPPQPTARLNNTHVATTAVVILTGFAVAIGAGCRTKKQARGTTRAAVVASSSDLVPGTAATGSVGDLRIENDKIAAIISHSAASSGFAATGGNLIDLAFRSGGDQLNEVILYLQETFPRQAHYDRVEVLNAGGKDITAVVLASGHDTHNPKIKITTRYEVQPGASYITLRSHFTNTSTLTVSNYSIGDAVQWGRTEHMAPGHGFALPGRELEVDWVCGLGDGVSYAVVPDGSKTFDCLSGNVWSDPVGLTANMEPGQAIEYARHVVVGHGDTASLAEVVASLRKQQTGILSGQVLHQGVPVKGARVWVLTEKESSIVGMARAMPDGRFEIRLPPGRYRAQADAPGREPTTRDEIITIANNATAVVKLNVGATGTAVWRIVDERKKPLAARLTWLGVGSTETPHFGPAYHAAGAENHIVSVTGEGTTELVPGTYRVVVSSGPEYTRFDEIVTVSPQRTATISVALKRVVPTQGLIGADLHQHARPSFDSAVNLVDRVASNLAEGVEVLVATDHDALTDYSDAVRHHKAQDKLTTIVGTEATTHSVGHFNAFPLVRQEGKDRGGMFDAEGMKPVEIFRRLRALNGGQDIFLQVNHPRSDRTGYFQTLGFDRALGRAPHTDYDQNFDGIEVVVADEPKETQEGLLDWFALLQAGHQITATGSSDSHTISRRPVGWPRTYVCSDSDDPATIDAQTFAKTLRDGCATVSRGPIVTIEVGKTKMGGLAKVNQRPARLRVRVVAAPWVAADRLVLYVDGKVKKTIELKGNKPVRHDSLHPIKCARDCWVAAWVEGDASLAPTLGRPGQPAPQPVALSNPIFMDVDGDGRFTAAKAKR